MIKIKHLPLEIYGKIYEFARFKKIAKNFLPEDYHLRVLCYHDISNEDLPLFEKQIIFLKNEYNIINAEQFRNFFLGRGFLQGTNIFLTFDDGSVEQYEAARILDKYKIQGCFFVNTGDRNKKFLVSRPNSNLPPMSWDQIKDLHKRRHIIGSHSANHYNFSKIQPSEITKELSESKRIIEEQLADKIDFFAFPYGTALELTQEAVLIAKQFYDFNFIFLPGKENFASANRYLIKRTGVSPKYSFYHLRALMSGLKDWTKSEQAAKLNRFL